MKTGGYRPGAGQPRKKAPAGGKALPKDIVADAKAAKQTPLEYMLAVMNDPTAELYRRDRMAIAAASFCHPRISDAVVGKKEQARADAKLPDRATSIGALMGVRQQADAFN